MEIFENILINLPQRVFKLLLYGVIGQLWEPSALKKGTWKHYLLVLYVINYVSYQSRRPPASQLNSRKNILCYCLLVKLR